MPLWCVSTLLFFKLTKFHSMHSETRYDVLSSGVSFDVERDDATKPQTADVGGGSDEDDGDDAWLHLSYVNATPALPNALSSPRATASVDEPTLTVTLAPTVRACALESAPD